MRLALDLVLGILVVAVVLGAVGEIRTRAELAELERNPLPADVRIAR